MEQITEKQIKKMLHALGILWNRRKCSNIKPHVIYRPKPMAYRNYWQEELDSDWENLVEVGMAKKTTAIGLPVYFVAEKGIIHLQTMGYNFKTEQSCINAGNKADKLTDLTVKVLKFTCVQQ